MRPKRRLGQHFLTDPRILARIADAVDPDDEDTVLEIGPGRGALTDALVPRAGRVVAIERDPDLLAGLKACATGAELVGGDALALDWDAVAGSSYIVAGNIPYNITSPLLEKAFDARGPRRIVFLLQREVADRLAARPGSKAYGAITVGVRALATVERLFAVSAGAFSPPPEVESAVVRLTPRADPDVGVAERMGFRRMVTGLFGLRRKQLLRAVRQLSGLDRDAAGALLAAVDLPQSIRPEGLEPVEFARLYRALVDGGGWRG